MYNGYKNYYTWALANFITNDEPTYKHYQAVLEQVRYVIAPEKVQAAFAKSIQAEITDPNFIDEDSSRFAPFYKSVLVAALEEVDFEEVAAYFISE